MAKNYIAALEKARMKVDDAEIVEIAHTTIFLASKMRERDIYCPMSSHISRVGGECLNLFNMSQSARDFFFVDFSGF